MMVEFDDEFSTFIMQERPVLWDKYLDSYNATKKKKKKMPFEQSYRKFGRNNLFLWFIILVFLTKLQA
jgi:hypothetical protein